jgi:triphosphoribosyl-dephospho-CoA synthase
MRSGASGSDLLAARDARAALIARLCARRDGDGHRAPPRALVFASLAVPGPDKTPAGAGAALACGVEALRRALAGRPWEELDRGTDALGPWATVGLEADPEPVKRAAAGIEGSLPFGRVLDLDVYAEGGRPVDRAGLGLPQRRCLVCEESARECITLRRHAGGEPAARAAALLEPLGPRRSGAADLAAALAEGAQEELDLTPKPGLVDRHDNGSHPDLSYDAMARSVRLLPLYFDELAALRGAAGAGAGEPAGLAACVAAGRRAEERMRRAAGSNAHRGLIFLGGLVVLAACDACRDGEPGDEGTLRRRVADLAREFCGRAAPDAADTPGARARSAHGVRGILGEACAGLPAVFEAALPAHRAMLARGGDRRLAALRAMAALMLVVDDTTALHRAGRAGLARLRTDGGRLAALLDAGEDPGAQLARWNADYRRAGLTMGGVADCLALALAFARSTRSSTTRLAWRFATIPARGAIGVMPLGDSLSSSPQR